MQVGNKRLQQQEIYVGCEVLTAVVMKSTIFWDITPWGPLKVYRRFGGTRHLHFQGRKISQAGNQLEAGSKQSWFLTWFILDPEDRGDISLRNVG
jgi:hypothetical protein